NCSDTSENMERDQNDTIIVPFQRSNESSPGMTLLVAMYGSSSGTTTPTPQPPSNIPSYVENVQQLVASTLSNNQSSKPSNLRVTTPSVGNINTTYLQPLVSQLQIGNYSRSTSTTTSQSVPSSQPSNNINTSQPILTPQPAIVPIGGNNNNAYL
ncbi:6642_t:CDS:2, partial [Funneliformis caledonium]